MIIYSKSYIASKTQKGISNYLFPSTQVVLAQCRYKYKYTKLMAKEAMKVLKIQKGVNKIHSSLMGVLATPLRLQIYKIYVKRKIQSS